MTNKNRIAKIAKDACAECTDRSLGLNACEACVAAALSAVWDEALEKAVGEIHEIAFAGKDPLLVRLQIINAIRALKATP